MSYFLIYLIKSTVYLALFYAFFMLAMRGTRFNPMVWLVRMELKQLHESEADEGVVNQGIDATQYQILLVRKRLAKSSTPSPTALTTPNFKNVLL